MQIEKVLDVKGLRHNAGALIFPALLLAAILVELLLPGLAVWLGLPCFVLGFPHGAADEQGGVFTAYRTERIGAYVLVAASVGALYLVQPLVGLTLFFALSAWHFAREGEHGSAAGSWAVALLAIGGSMVFQPRATTSILSAATGTSVPELYAMVLAAVGALGVVLAIAAASRAQSRAFEALLAVAAVALLHPVLAVGIIFLGTHALPVQRSQIVRYGPQTVRDAVGITSIAAMIGAVVIAWAVIQGLIQIPVAAAVAFGLATPHMITDRLDK